MVRENLPETSEDRVVNRYLNKCFQNLLNRVDLKYSFKLSGRSEKGGGRYRERIQVSSEGQSWWRNFFGIPKVVANIERLPFKEETEKLKLEIMVLNLNYLEEIKTVVVEAMENHSVKIRIRK